MIHFCVKMYQIMLYVSFAAFVSVWSRPLQSAVNGMSLSLGHASALNHEKHHPFGTFGCPKVHIKITARLCLYWSAVWQSRK